MDPPITPAAKKQRCVPPNQTEPKVYTHCITEIMDSWYQHHNEALHRHVDHLLDVNARSSGDKMELSRRVRRLQLGLDHQQDLTDALLQGIAEFISATDRDTSGFLKEKLAYACRDHGLRLSDYLDDEDETDDDLELNIETVIEEL